MKKRNQATSWKLVLGVLVGATGCGSDGGGNNGLTGTGGAPIGAGGSGAAPGGQAGIGTATAGSTTVGAAGRAGAVAGSGSSTAGTIASSAGTGGMTAGTGTITGGTGAITAGTGTGTMTMAGTRGMTAGTDAMTAGTGGTPMSTDSGCTPMPTGTFMVTQKMGGPSGDYTIFQPTTLGENGFKHPPVAWGNGLATTPSLYVEWLTKVASNGFVVIANPGTGSDPQVVRQGLEWLIAQGKGTGDYAGKLAENCAGTIGYSMGGGAAVGSGSHPEVRAVVSVHGLQDAAENVNGPLLLTTSDDDSFVSPMMSVIPCYNRSTKQPTIMATYVSGKTPSFDGHLTPLGDGKQDADPTIQWLRYWLYGDQAARKWFFGADCTLCTAPWMAQKKNGNFD